MVFAVVLLILGAVMPVWFGAERGHGFLGFLSYVVVLVIAGFIGMNVLTVGVIVLAGISVIFLIYQLVDYKNWKKRKKDAAAAKSRRDIGLLDAVTNHEKENVQKLIAEGADVNYKDIFNKTPLYVAVENGDKDIVSILAEKADVNFVYDGKTIVQYAKDDEIITVLRNHGAKTKTELEEAEKEQDNLNTDFVVAVGCHDVERAKSLISRISNIDTIDQGLVVKMIGARLDGTGGEVNRESAATPLIYAVWNDDIEMVRLLVENGAGVDIRDSHDKTALMYAATNFEAEHHVEIIDFLISKGANVNALCSDPAENFKYQTALMFATINGDVDSVQTLIRNGADVNAKMFRGFESITALGLAEYCGFKEVEILLRKNGARS